MKRVGSSLSRQRQITPGVIYGVHDRTFRNVREEITKLRRKEERWSHDNVVYYSSYLDVKWTA